MVQRLAYLKETPSQTAGPYVHIGLTPTVAGIAGVYPEDPGRVVAGPQAAGPRIRITGCIYDGADAPVRDALVELWQADANGLYASPRDMRPGARDPHVRGWGRCATDLATGAFAFETIKPGPVPAPDGREMAPHIALWIVARGINVGLATRLYFPEETDANAADPVLARVHPAARRDTLIATAEGETDGVAQYRFDIRLQGARETVFFDA